MNTTVKIAYAIKTSWKFKIAKKNKQKKKKTAFSQGYQWGAILHNELHFEVDPGILFSLSASTHHLHTTIGTGNSLPGKNPIVVNITNYMSKFER